MPSFPSSTPASASLRPLSAPKFQSVAAEAVKAQGAAQAAHTLAVGAAQMAAALAVPPPVPPVVPRESAKVRPGNVGAGPLSAQSSSASLVGHVEETLPEGTTILPETAHQLDEATVLPEVMEGMAISSTVLDSFTPSPCQSFLQWEVDAHNHPMVTGSERQCAFDCLQELDSLILREGGLDVLSSPDCKTRLRLIGKAWRPELGVEELLRMLLEGILKVRARTGNDGIFVESGYVMSMGSKKILKLQIWCVDVDISLRVSICWDWDVKLHCLPP